MRKFRCAVLALVLCLALAAGACAETVLKETAQFPGKGGVDVVSGTDYLVLGNYNGKALARLDGTVLTDAAYTSFSSEYGYFSACLSTGGWTYGLLDGEGNVIIPFEYGDVDILSDTWAAAVIINENGTKEDHDYYLMFSNADYGLIETVDIYNLKDAKKAASFTRDHYEAAKASGDILHIYDRTEEKTYEYDASFELLGNPNSFYRFPNETREEEEYKSFYLDGKYGLKNAADEVILEAQYDYIEDVREGYAKLKLGDKYGIASVDGSVVVPVEYELSYTSGSRPSDMKYDPYVYFGYVPVVKDEAMGFVSVKDGAFTEIPVGEGDKIQPWGLSTVVEGSDGVYTIYAADGTVTRLEGYEYCYGMDYTLGRYYRVRKSEAGYGVVNWHGEEVLPCEYGYTIEFISDGRRMVAYQEDTDTVFAFEVTDELVAE